jgi:hypothetical protein
MRRASKVDDNQAAVVAALRKIGCSVQSLAAVGSGCVDLLVGFAGDEWLIEVKDGSKPPSARKLTPDEATWHSQWQGRVYIVESAEQAIAIVTGGK